MTLLINCSDRNKARILFFVYSLMLLYFDNEFSFMIFNLFLAFVALELSYVLPLFTIKSKSEIPISILVYTVFVLLSPNIFYVVTDLIHLKSFSFNFWETLERSEWWHFFILTTGVMIAVFYYHLMIQQIRSVTKQSKWGPLLLLIFIVLGSIGIYIGRFLRFHSVHVFTEPFSIVKQFLSSLTTDSILFITWISLLQLLVVWIFPKERKE
ncbi:DUF1361 domain-containing protein [Paenibacillus sp. L3-i20]|uniref:DUF1361 domain-containing protein n=1 Tax=Paenibacillus sp. L3-i20 TaxID=2905833 RepID=UPI001EDECCA6|nr:DUF1361 domain-containing protein [Paenibacillus sp. L3-i20]GKU78108.1 DUF1361 domain-containing protein [Paenibacillus sp. L3-i20]